MIRARAPASRVNETGLLALPKRSHSREWLRIEVRHGIGCSLLKSVQPQRGNRYNKIALDDTLKLATGLHTDADQINRTEMESEEVHKEVYERGSTR